MRLIDTNCDFSGCQKRITTEPWRIRRGRVVCCTVACKRKWMVENGVAKRLPPTADQKERCRELYENSNKAVQKIAILIDIDRATLKKWIIEEDWKREHSRSGLRTKYRRAAEHKIGRDLFPFEHVHHIDGCKQNCEEINLHVYPGAREHKLAHISLENCAFALFKSGVIGFDEKTGVYFLREKI